MWTVARELPGEYKFMLEGNRKLHRKGPPPCVITHRSLAIMQFKETISNIDFVLCQVNFQIGMDTGMTSEIIS